MSGAGWKTPSQCKMRWERILNPGVKRGLWTKEEDQKLKEVAAAMEYKWSHVSLLFNFAAPQVTLPPLKVPLGVSDYIIAKFFRRTSQAALRHRCNSSSDSGMHGGGM